MIHVLDASALLAVSKGERGADFVMDLINTKDCVISSVNMAEVGARLLDLGLPIHELGRGIAQFSLDIVDFNQEQALASAALRPLTKSAGLSLGDRACIALAQLMRGCVVTSDRAWLEISEAVGVKVIMIR
jgi:PIN domain nuclease of toxin-antitoxin system